MRVLVLVAIALSPACKKSGSLDPADPSKAADALFDRYIEATGGLEASKKILNMRIEAVIEVPAQGITMPMLILEERPDRSRIEATMPMVGTMLSGHADGVAWELNPMMGPIVKSGAEAEQAARTSRIDLFEEYRIHWPTRSVVGTVEFASTRCQQVDAVTSTGVEESIFFAVDTGLYMGSRTMVRTDMGELPMENMVESYETVDGNLIPAVTRQKAGPIDTITRFTKIEINVDDLPDLTPPPEIMELVAQ